MIGPAEDFFRCDREMDRPATEPAPAVLIIGVGNLLMGDEGAGLHALKAVEHQGAIPGTATLDGGTGGINLLEVIERAPKVIMIDATRDGRPAGTITLLRPQYVAEMPHGLSAHDFGLRDLFAAAALLGRFPEMHLFTISVETIQPMSMTLSLRVGAAIPEVAHAVRALAQRLVTETCRT